MSEQEKPTVVLGSPGNCPVCGRFKRKIQSDVNGYEGFVYDGQTFPSDPGFIEVRYECDNADPEHEREWEA